MKQKMTKEEFFSYKLPGVTSVLSEVLGKDEFADIPKAVMDAACERGHKVHEYIETFINTGKMPEIELAYQIYIDYFMDWYNEYQPTFMRAEQMLVDEKLGYKGIVDCVCTYNDKLTNRQVICMIDWKTSSNLNRFKTMCQLNLYERLFRRQDKSKIRITEIRTLSLTKTGYRFSKFELSNDISNSILLLYNLKKKYNNGGE